MGLLLPPTVEVAQFFRVFFFFCVLFLVHIATSWAFIMGDLFPGDVTDGNAIPA